MKYMLMLYVRESGWDELTPEQQAEGIAAYKAYGEALEKAGAFVATDRLGPSASATTLTMADGKPQVIDGPFADSKEQIGGYYIIDVPDLDAALEWAGRCPAAHHGKIEIRPVWAM